MLSLKSEGTTMQMRHLIIDGSSPWLIGRNVTTKGNMIHANGNRLEFPQHNGLIDTINLVDHDMHSFIAKERFYHHEFNSLHDPTIQSLCSATAATVNEDRKKTQRLIDKVHKHVCGHSNYRDIQPLLERNNIWSEECKKYLTDILETCPGCHATELPSQPRTVSIANLSRDFNQLVFVDHFFQDELSVFHVIDAKSTYSSGSVVNSLSLSDAVASFETSWMSQFWAPVQCQGDQAFTGPEFQEYLKAMGTEFRASPPRRKYKNALEAKHRVIRSIFERLKVANPRTDKRILSLQSIRISNDLGMAKDRRP